MRKKLTNLAVTNFNKHVRKSSQKELSDLEYQSFVESFLRLDEADYEEIVAMLRVDMQLLDAYLGFQHKNDQLELPEIFNVTAEHCNAQELPESWLEESLEACYTHQNVYEHADPITIEIRSLRSGNKGSGAEVRISITDQNPVIGTYLWDKIRYESDDPIADALSCSLFNERVSYVVNQLEIWKPKPLFEYHPERYKQTRRYLTDIPSALAANGLSELAMSQEAIQVVFQSIMMDFNRGNKKVPRRDKHTETTGPSTVPKGELEFWILYSGFTRAGRQIFDLGKSLIEMFRNTGVDDVPVRLLTSPYQSYYLHFGKQKHLSLSDGWPIDGAYVQHYPESNLIQFLFTSIPDVDESARHWVTKKEPCFALSITEEHFSLNLGEAISLVIDERKKELQEKIAKGNVEYTDQFPGVAKKLISNNETTGKLRLKALEREYPVMQQALEIAVNAMCYLTAYPDDISREWPASTPKKMVDKASKGHPRSKKNTLSKLQSMGYHKINICGRALHQGPADNNTGVHTVRTHWRKGHWKRQPYGPNSELRKLVLIKPTLVNPGKGHQNEVLGSIYIGENIIEMKTAKKTLLDRSDKK